MFSSANIVLCPASTEKLDFLSSPSVAPAVRKTVLCQENIRSNPWADIRPLIMKNASITNHVFRHLHCFTNLRAWKVRCMALDLWGLSKLAQVEDLWIEDCSYRDNSGSAADIPNSKVQLNCWSVAVMYMNESLGTAQDTLLSNMDFNPQ